MTKRTIDAGRVADRRVWIRMIVYTAATHVFAGFILLLFELGSRNK
ncbi:DUF6126 family protein [Kitasatospora sp. GP82]|nr:DUF6126 family protein [Kitasatospora sp. GP82]MDH6128975.1 hypothetical protein [Kitasatospora sp. GP82]